MGDVMLQAFNRDSRENLVFVFRRVLIRRDLTNRNAVCADFLAPFLSPPVHFARWALMCRFLSVCLDWTKNQTRN